MLISPVLLAPHLPTLLVDEHRGHRTEMLEAFAASADRLREAMPDQLVVLSARWMSNGPFLVDDAKSHRTITDYSGFGVEVRYDCKGHTKLARHLVEAGVKARVRAASTRRGVDSGVSVPLRFLAPARDLPVVPLSLAPQPVEACRAWGGALRRALDAWPERVAFVAGGVLSFNRHAWEMRRDLPEAADFDAWALDALRTGSWDRFARPDRKLAHVAEPEAALLHLEVLRGLLGHDARAEVACYEPGPGVGAVLAAFAATAPADAEPSARATDAS